MTAHLPLIAITLGDVAGIGPEICVRAVRHPEIRAACRPILVGCPRVVQRALRECGWADDVQEIALTAGTLTWPEQTYVVWNPSTAPVDSVSPGHLSAVAGRAACDWLIAAGNAALSGQVAAIVTAPLNKAALHAAGVRHPGHTEILGELCGVRDVAMMLHLPGQGVNERTDLSLGPLGLSVAHVTLHTALASVPGLLTTQRITATIALMDNFLRRLGSSRPRIGVAALNPHAGELGLFGDEEARVIAPAVRASQHLDSDIRGPIPADALIQQACAGQFDGVIAMYHDQGHIPLKLIGRGQAVNVTLGLPFVRTSPSHGTAFDIAGKNRADATAMQSAILTAVRLCSRPNTEPRR